MSRAIPRRSRFSPSPARAWLSLLVCACGAVGPPPGDGSTPPVAAASVDREVGPAPLRACFDASANAGPDGGAASLAIAWDFGDGSARARGAAACHVYAEPGSYAVSVEATDGAGRSALAVVVVTATAP